MNGSQEFYRNRARQEQKIINALKTALNAGSAIPVRLYDPGVTEAQREAIKLDKGYQNLYGKGGYISIDEAPPEQVKAVFWKLYGGGAGEEATAGAVQRRDLYTALAGEQIARFPHKGGVRSLDYLLEAERHLASIKHWAKKNKRLSKVEQTTLADLDELLEIMDERIAIMAEGRDGRDLMPEPVKRYGR